MNYHKFAVTLSLCALGLVAYSVMPKSSIAQSVTNIDQKSEQISSISKAQGGIFDPGDHKGTPDNTRGYKVIISSSDTLH